MDTPTTPRTDGRTKCLVATVRDFVADLLFPRACVSCGADGTFFCERCLAAVPRKREHTCPVCDTVRTPDGRTCLRCRKRARLDGIFAASDFKDPRGPAEAIRVLKYEYVSELALPLGRLLAKHAEDTDLPLPDLVIPVPLHPWRERYRGFNQSALIAESFASSFLPDLPPPVRTDLLVRTRFTMPQARSGGSSERRKNLRDAFSLRPTSRGNDLKGKTAWLIDDVATTGATLEECAKVLKKSGAKEAYGIVVAR